MEDVRKLQGMFAANDCPKEKRSYGKLTNATDSSIFTQNSHASLTSQASQMSHHQMLCFLCKSRCGQWGCIGCRRPFCKSCYQQQHRRNAPVVTWMFDDAVTGAFARTNPTRWSADLSFVEAIKQMEE